MEADDVRRLDLKMEWKPGHVAAYLVEGTDGVALVDAGVASDEGVEELRDKVSSAGYAFDGIDAVLVTHPHLDHDGAVSTLVEEGDPTVYAYETVPDSLSVDEDEESIHANVREAGMRGTAADEAVERWLSGVRDNSEHLPPDEIDVLLSDGETFETVGKRFEAVHTPGHQRDHICYASDGILFAGDAVAESFRPVIYHAGFDNGMWEAVEACYGTFERLGERDADRVFPGHGPVFDDLDGAVDGALGSLDSLVEDVYSKVDSLDEPTALDVTLARKKPEHDVGYVVFDSIGALGYLDEKGRVDSWLEDGFRRFDVTG